MTAFTEGIRPLADLRWVSWPGVVVDLWDAAGDVGGGGHYLSPDPRIVVFLGPGADRVGMTCSQDAEATARIAYIPAGAPAWTRIRAPGPFRHVDLHFGTGGVAAFRAAGAKLPTAPILLDAHTGVEGLAVLIADEVGAGRADATLLTGLAMGMLGYLRQAEDAGRALSFVQTGGLTPVQHRRVVLAMRDGLHRRLSVAELAEVAGLSESWFARAFRTTTGETPARALTHARVDRAKLLLRDGGRSLADIAAATGFADQAHFTRVFRAFTSATPAVWRASARSGVEGAIPR